MKSPQHEGQWIVWDMDEERLVAVGAELDGVQPDVRRV